MIDLSIYRLYIFYLFSIHRSLISQLQKLQGLISSKVPRPSSARSTQTGTCLMVSLNQNGCNFAINI